MDYLAEHSGYMEEHNVYIWRCTNIDLVEHRYWFSLFMSTTLPCFPFSVNLKQKVEVSKLEHMLKHHFRVNGTVKMLGSVINKYEHITRQSPFGPH
jgi:hypothetical protein